MKNKNLLSFVIFSILFCSTFMNVYSQCPGCAISMTCTASPAKPAICPDTLPQGTAMQPYSEDISFYLPGTFVDEGSGYTVDLDQMQVLNIIGMPLGLSWQTNKSPTNIYSPHGNVNDQHGCAKICGTPYSAGDYIVTVFVKADVSVVSLGGIAQTSNTSFEIPIKILPGSSSNNSFSISNPFGCAPLSTSFTTTNPSNGNTNFHYAWDFGNGNQSSLETPPSQNYTIPGNYLINLTTTIDTLSYYLTGVSVNSATGCNDSPWSSPDYYFNLLKAGTTIYAAPYIDNTDPPVSFSFSPIKLANATYNIHVYDYDNGLAGGDDDCGEISLNGHTAGTYTVNSGALSVTYTVNHPIINITSVDTIKVYASPTVSALSFMPNDSICYGDSIKLSAITSAVIGYQWYKDTNAVMNANDSIYFAKENGIYYLEATNNHGCRTNSNNKKLTFIDYPPKPTFWIVGNTIQTNLSGFSLQWYFNGVEINNATNMLYNMTQSGAYHVVATNYFGCATSSDTVQATYTNAIDENSQVSGMKIYPNPNKGIFNVELNLNFNSDVEIMIFDMIGKVAFNDKSTTFSGNYKKEIDLSNLAKGIYTANITVNGEIMRSKIIIQ
jgi:hypothetical protein